MKLSFLLKSLTVDGCLFSSVYCATPCHMKEFPDCLVTVKNYMEIIDLWAQSPNEMFKKFNDFVNAKRSCQEQWKIPKFFRVFISSTWLEYAANRQWGPFVWRKLKQPKKKVDVDAKETKQCSASLAFERNGTCMGMCKKLINNTTWHHRRPNDRIWMKIDKVLAKFSCLRKFLTRQ